MVLDNVQRRRINILCKGTYELRPAVGKTYKMRHEFSSPRLNKCISCFPCLCFMSITRRHKKVFFAPSEETKRQTRSPTKDATHPPPNTHTHRQTHTHYPTSCFRRPRIPEVHGFRNLFYMNWQKLWCVICLLQPFCVLWYKILSVSSSINPSIQKLIHT